MDENISNHLKDKIHQEVLREIIQNYLKLSKPLDQYKIVYSSGTGKGDNYIGIIYRIQVKDIETGTSKLNLIVKLAPSDPKRRADFTVAYFFKLEIIFYENVYPMFRAYQEQKGVDVQKDGFHHVAFCYKALKKEPREEIYFEDLKAKGFVMFDRFQEVTKDQVFLVMKALAKMHALSFSMKNENPKALEAYYGLKDGWTVMGEGDDAPWRSWYKYVKFLALGVVEKSSNKELIEKVKNFVKTDFMELFNRYHSREYTEPYAVICHGDCWNNNTMFRYDENGFPIDLRLVDFQQLKYSTPITDLMYYIFGCTTKSLRDKYYQEFLDVYYEELSTFMKKLGSDPNKIFPRKVFNEQLKKFGSFGLLMGIIVLPLFTSDADDIPEIEDIGESFKNLESNKKKSSFVTEKVYNKYAERMMGVCEDISSLGYI